VQPAAGVRANPRTFNPAGVPRVHPRINNPPPGTGIQPTVGLPRNQTPIVTPTQPSTSIDSSTSGWTGRNRGDGNWTTRNGVNNGNQDWRTGRGLRGDSGNWNSNNTVNGSRGGNWRNSDGLHTRSNGNQGNYRRHNWSRHHRNRSWWRNNYTRFALFGGGYYYWNSGYWYPAYGYDPYFTTYTYDAPLYAYNDMDPGQVIANVQQALQQQGYYQGELDGTFGPMTRQALLDYQRDNGLPVTGEIDRDTLSALGFE
jgi:hypothetical protein